MQPSEEGNTPAAAAAAVGAGQSPTDNQPSTSSQPAPQAQGPAHLKTETVWKATKFREQGTEEKFRKLMGIKDDNIDGEGEAEKLTDEQTRRQEELFSQLDREYAFARMATHTHRGIGLGFQSQGMPP